MKATRYKISDTILLSTSSLGDTLAIDVGSTKSDFFVFEKGVSSDILQMMAKKKSHSQIVDSICQKYDAKPKTVDADVLTFAKSLKSQKILIS